MSFYNLLSDRNAGTEYTAEGFGTDGFWDKPYNGDMMETGTYGADGGLFDQWTGKDMVAGAMGAGQFGLGLANYFENKKMNSARIDGLNQQITESKFAIQDRKDFKNNTRSAFGA